MLEGDGQKRSGRRAAANIRIRSLSRLIRPISCSSAAARSMGSRYHPETHRQAGDGLWVRVKGKQEDQTDRLLAQIEPHDLMKYGLIPELIGRLPAIVSLDTLDEAALVRILQGAQNALVKQYETLFAMDGVALSFEPEALARWRRSRCSARPARAGCVACWKA